MKMFHKLKGLLLSNIGIISKNACQPFIDFHVSTNGTLMKFYIVKRIIQKSFSKAIFFQTLLSSVVETKPTNSIQF